MNLDTKYREILFEPLRKCAHYQPKLGYRRSGGFDLESFKKLYGEDPFYNWLGLDSPLIYAAHKAAGGITSVYRQIGLGCEKLFRAILMDELELTHDQANWSYEVPRYRSNSESTKILSLDGRIPLEALQNQNKREIVQDWIDRVSQNVGIKDSVRDVLSGVVFEIRQGYKSRDSKRQNADIVNATNAYINSYLPCVGVFSTQIDRVVKDRYKSENWVILSGTISNDDTESIYAFCDKIIGYDLVSFFERNTSIIKSETEKIVQVLLEIEV